LAGGGGFVLLNNKTCRIFQIFLKNGEILWQFIHQNVAAYFSGK
jgi:hypothetical protein